MSDSPILVIGECHGGQLLPAAGELVAAGKAVGNDEIVFGLFGSGLDNASATAASLDVGQVVVVDNPSLAAFATEPATRAVQAMVEAVNPSVVIVAGTTSGRDFAPRLAARLDAVSYPDVTGITASDGSLVLTRPVYGGKAVTEISVPPDVVAVISVRPGAFAEDVAGGGNAKISSISVELLPDDRRVQVVGYVDDEDSSSVKLEEASVIVSGGRGLKEPENFVLIEQLAGALGGVVGASRAVVDAGWRGHQEQVGQTGRTVSPKLYVAVGISGAVQHIVGMQGSDTIVAINRDPDAPIFRVASYGIVGDLFDVVPALVEALNAPA